MKRSQKREPSMASPKRTRSHPQSAPRTTRISSLAHDLANALGSISARVSVLATRDLPPEVTSNLESVVADIRRARELIHEIVRTSRSDLRQRLLLPERVKHAIAATGLELEGAKVQLTCGTESAVVLVNRAQIDAVLESIFGAELESLRTSTPKLRVDVQLTWEANGLLLTVQTTSPEISEANLPRLLSPFFLRQAAGFGNGLSFGICAQIARDHEGRFSIGRSPAGGREYRLELPALDAHRARKQHSPPPESPAASSHARGHLLVIDDDEQVLESYGLMVKHLGYTMDLARSGEEALRCLDRKSFDAVILDFHLGGPVDGDDVLRTLERKRPEILRRTLLSTGDPHSARLREFTASLGIQVLAKPFGVQELCTAIESVENSR